MKQEHLDLFVPVLDKQYIPLLPLLLQPKSEQDNLTKNRSRAYTAFCLSKLLSIDKETASKSVVDDYDDRGIDAVYYHQNEKKLYIVQGKFKKGEVFKQEDAQTFITGIRDLSNQLYERFNQNIQNRKEELDFAFDDADQIILVVAHTSLSLTKHAKDEIDFFLKDNAKELDPRFQEGWIDLGEIYAVEELLGEHAAKPVHTSLYLSGDSSVRGQYNIYFGLVSVRALADLYEKHKNDLFEKNIRYFLGLPKSDVNRAINRTLEKEPENFFYLNNGVTALAKQISPKNKRGNKRLYKLNYFSVINGAQTIASSHHFVKSNPEAKIDDASVMITLIEVDNDIPFGVKITKSRNYQNKVTESQFAALDPQQERIRRELAILNITYHYRPEGNIEINEDVVTIGEAVIALALFSQDPFLPVLLKQNLTSFFDPENDNYKKIFKNDLTGKKLANAVKLYRSANATLASNEAGSDNGSVNKMIYRHGRYVTIWLAFNSNMAWLVRNDIMTVAQASELLSLPLDQWKEFVRLEAELELARVYKGALAFFRNQTNTQPFVIRLRDRGI